MKRRTLLFLKTAVVIIAIIMLGLCVFWLPHMANVLATDNPEFAYLKLPVLFGLYATVIPFYVALYESFKLLNYIEAGNAFSIITVVSLKRIKECAGLIILLYIVGMLILTFLKALHPGIALFGLGIVFASLVIAVFAALLQELLRNAIELKTENDLTV